MHDCMEEGMQMRLSITDDWVGKMCATLGFVVGTSVEPQHDLLGVVPKLEAINAIYGDFEEDYGLATNVLALVVIHSTISW